MASRSREVIAGRLQTSALLGLKAAAYDLLAGALGQIDPRIALGVTPGGARARRVRRLAIVLCRLGDAVALLVLEFRHRRRAPLGTGLQGQRKRHRHRGTQHDAAPLHRTSSCLVVPAPKPRTPAPERAIRHASCAAVAHPPRSIPHYSRCRWLTR